MYRCFQQLKRVYSKAESAKWVNDLPQFVQMYHRLGRFEEDVATQLNYTEDTDESGGEHPLTASMTSQHHRQRATIPTNPTLLQQLSDRSNDAAADAREKQRQSLLLERRWRHDTLMENGNAETKLHLHAERPANSDRSSLQLDDTDDAIIQAIYKLSKDEAIPFVSARSLTSKSDKSFKNKPANLGNRIEILKATSAKVNADSNAKLDRNENTWRFQAWKKYKDQLRLVQMDEHVVAEEDEEMDQTSRVLSEEIIVYCSSQSIA